MSVKAMALVWDLKCPQEINSLEFRPNHKYVLIAYADHADHHGKNIWPAVPTIAEKTGLDDRTVQRMTHDLESMGILIDDGRGPRGTNKWKLPFNDKGDSLTPVTVSPTERGDNGDKSLGDNPSGDNPSGVTVSPELKEPEPGQFTVSNKYVGVWDDAKEQLKSELGNASFETWVQPTKAVHFDFDNSLLWIATRNDYACNWLMEHIQEKAQAATGLYIKFVVVSEVLQDTEV